jgi:hypothetical protein
MSEQNKGEAETRRSSYQEMFESYQLVGEVVACMETARVELRAQGYTDTRELMEPEMREAFERFCELTNQDPSSPI